MLEGKRSYQRGQETLVPNNNASSAPDNPVIPKDQERPWYIRHFIKLLIGFGLGGGAVAILLPWMLWQLCGMSSGSSDQLRLHLLYVTGGIIAVLTLLQTNWKNQGDRLKIDADIKKNEQDAENEATKREQDAVKSERDHIRQVHTERRSRYTKAVEQLADEKATVRLGGIYTLVGLVDEWLTDDTLEVEEQQKEGQVIINNLCSYIRSPFPLAEEIEEYEAHKELEKLQKTESEKLNEEESSRLQVLLKRFEDSGEYEKPKDITADYAKFHEEQDVRRTIFVEMSKRSSISFRAGRKVIKTVLGIWSNFDFDFARAPIFYPLSSLTIEKGNFSSAKFYTNADFRWVVFTQNANFQRTSFANNADFSGATFVQTANFRESTITGTANFPWVIITGTAYFRWATFIKNADFSGATITRFSDFREVTFAQNANFSRVIFVKKAYFSGAIFTQNANFSSAVFKAGSPRFVVTSGGPEATIRAQFAALAKDQEAHNFTVAKGSFRIPPGEAELGDGIIHRIPVGTVLFDPDSWDEEKQEYTRVSEPAKPLDVSDEAEENKSK